MVWEIRNLERQDKVGPVVGESVRISEQLLLVSVSQAVSATLRALLDPKLAQIRDNDHWSGP